MMNQTSQTPALSPIAELLETIVELLETIERRGDAEVKLSPAMRRMLAQATILARHAVTQQAD